ncbi:integrase [Vibrio splendidus]|nr:integrase [Vibrio splendidus]
MLFVRYKTLFYVLARLILFIYTVILGFIMSIRNLKDGSTKPWICECYPNGRAGKRVRKKFATKGEAKAFELHTMKEIDDKPWMGDKPDHRRLSQIIELWYQLHGVNTKSGLRAKRRMEIVCEALNDPIANQLNERMLAHYRAKRIYKGRNIDRLATNQPISIATHNHDLIWLKSMFNELIRLKEWKGLNPIADLRKLKTSEPELAFLTVNQINHLLDEVKSSPMSEDLTAIIKLCLATGARIREAIEIKGAQLSKFKVTYINTKGKRNRTVPISEELYQLIHKDTSGRLFSCAYSTVYKWLTRALPNLPKGQGTHVLRHTFASHFMMNGGNILVLQNILGHTDISMTMRYSHFAPSHLSDAIHFNPLNSLPPKSGDKVATENVI